MYNYTPYGVGMSPYQQQLTQNRMEQPAIMAVDARIRLGACILRFKRFSAYA